MNKLFKIIPFFMLLFIVSCDRNEGAIYKGSLDKVFFTTNKNTYRLEIVRDDVGTLTIPFNASVLSPSDRTYSIELVEPEGDEVVADPLTYNLPTSVTIPANKWRGDIVIGGQDLGLVDTNAKTFRFRIKGLNEGKEFIDEDTVTVEVVEVCPLSPGVRFSGSYLVETIVEGSYGASFGPEIVTILEESEYTRTFLGKYLPGQSGGFAGRLFSFSLTCGEIIVNKARTGVGCGAGEGLSFNPAIIHSEYEQEDDSEFFITFTEEYGNCNAAAAQVVLKLTKQ